MDLLGFGAGKNVDTCRSKNSKSCPKPLTETVDSLILFLNK